MKFVVDSVKNGCRLGQVVTLGRHTDICLNTPLCMLYTKAGSAPNLSRAMLDKILEPPLLAHMPLPILGEHHEILTEYGKGIQSFAGMQDYFVYISLQDPAVAVPSGYNDKNSAAIWGRGGKVKVDVDLFIKMQEAMKPDCYQVLCDPDTDEKSSKKRLSKSVDRTINFLDRCLLRHDQSEILSKTDVFGTIVGGHSVQDRLRSAQETAKRPVAGFAIEGFHKYGPEFESFETSVIQDIVKQTVKHLPEDKPRIMQGVWSPDKILDVIEMGIDILDSSYPYIVTERGGGLIFNYNIPHHNEDMDITSNPTKRVRVTDTSPTSTQQTGQESSSSIGPNQTPVNADDTPTANTEQKCDQGGESTASNRPFELNLSEKKYFDDFGPILENCTCYTCQHHTRAYINHLLNTSELLAGVLLIIHNFHHYFGYFRAIRQALGSNRYTQLKTLIQEQLR